MPDADRILEHARRELSFEFVRASGPGGQNVNKVATSAQLRFDVPASTALSAAVKARLLKLAGRRVTPDGQLIIEARRFRTQDQNRQDAIARFDELLRRAMQEPKARVPTKATAASRQRRLEQKKRKGQIKRTRQLRSTED